MEPPIPLSLPIPPLVRHEQIPSIASRVISEPIPLIPVPSWRTETPLPRSIGRFESPWWGRPAPVPVALSGPVVVSPVVPEAGGGRAGAVADG